MRRDIPAYIGLTRIQLQDKIARYGWAVGDHTYGNPHIIEEGAGPLTVGRFCSFAGIKIILGNHVSSFGTTYPFDSFRGYWPAMNDTSCHSGHGVTIGSDVWIGEGSIILPGARVGHGAIIGAGAIVRGDIPPFAIVAGNPAQIVRYRFQAGQIERLLRTAWWDRTDEDINRLVPFLVSKDIDRLLVELER